MTNKTISVKLLEESMLQREATLKEMADIVKAGRVDEIDMGGRSPTPDERSAIIKAVKASIKKSRSSLAELRLRGFKYGTPKQSWEALQSLCEQLSQAPEGVDPELALWLVTAVNNTAEGDEKELMRELGFVHAGRNKVADPYAMTDRVLEIIKASGCSINSACKQAAEEFGVSPKTAWHWYTKRQNAYTATVVETIRSKKSK